MSLPEHQLLVMSGTTVGGDIWSTSLKTTYGTGSVITQPDQDELLKTTPVALAGAPATTFVGLAGVMTAFWNGSLGSDSNRPSFGSVFSLTSVKFNAIGPDGKYKYFDTSEFDVSPPVPGNNASANLSPRQTLAITFRPSFDRGPGAYGRMFWPAHTKTLTSPGQPYIPEGDAISARDYAILLIQTLNGATISGNSLTVCNISQTKAGVPVRAAVTRVDVDRVVDTQRRRTNRIPRSTVSGAV